MKEKFLKNIGIVAIIISIGFACLGIKIYYDMNTYFYTTDEIEKNALKGDWIGGISAPLLNFASFLMIMAAYLLQKEEIQSTRIEMKIQNKELIRQRFEDTFFKMISLHHEIVNGIGESKPTYISNRNLSGEVVLSENHRIISGRTYIKNIHKELEIYYRDILVCFFANDFSIINDVKVAVIQCKTTITTFPEITYGYKEELEDFFKDKENFYMSMNFSKEIYEEIFSRYEHNLGHYFRNLYHILKFVDRSQLTDYEKDEFIKIIFAQLSSSEILLVFYNCFVGQGKPNFRRLALKYKFFERMNKKLLLNIGHLTIFEEEEYFK